jgi:hypothetical protein
MITYVIFVHYPTSPAVATCPIMFSPPSLLWQLWEGIREAVHWIHLPEDRVQGQRSVNTCNELPEFHAGRVFLVPRRNQQRVKHDSVRWKWLISCVVILLLNYIAFSIVNIIVLMLDISKFNFFVTFWGHCSVIDKDPIILGRYSD